MVYDLIYNATSVQKREIKVVYNSHKFSTKKSHCLPVSIFYVCI